MKFGVPSRLQGRKWILATIGVPILAVAWWVFRPEKLWTNAKVNEPSPFLESTDPQPLYTGLLVGATHKASGRASIYGAADGKQYLRLTDFTTSNGPDVHVLLGRSDDQSLRQDVATGRLDSVELGPLKGNAGDQTYNLPASVDFDRYNTVLIYCERLHVVFGAAKLERF